MDELRIIAQRRRELEPLAYVFERFGAEDFRVCHELHREFKQLEEALRRRTA